jgi:glycine/D-amino acid oxidase-like deaminating enzyme
VNSVQERSRPYWLEAVSLGHAGRLASDETADVVVIGGGIAGLSVAYELAAAGQSVVVLDRGLIGGGMTCRTTAHLASTTDDSYQELIRKRGLECARLWFDSQACAVSRIEQVLCAERIDCDFARVDGYLFLAADGDRALLERELDAARNVGMDVQWQDSLSFGATQAGPCLRFPRQARVHPLKYLNGLFAAIGPWDGKVFGDSPVVSVEETEGGVTVKTEHGPSVRARAAVVATNSPINNRVALHSKQAPYRTYAIDGEVLNGPAISSLSQPEEASAESEAGTKTSA